MPKITLKRVTATDGTTADLYPTTTLDQIISEGTGSGGANESLSSYIDARFILASAKGQDNGVAELDGSGKVPFDQLPSSVTGGMKFVGTIDASAGTSEANAVGLGTLFDELTWSNWSTDAAELVGSYRVVTDAGYVKNTNGTYTISPYYSFQIGAEGSPSLDDSIGEEGDNASPIYLEKGDWIVYTAQREPTSGAKYYLFSIINNTYQNATTGLLGVVKLTDATNAGQYNASSNTGGLVNGASEVITENFLFDNITSGELNSGTDSNSNPDGSNQTLNQIAASNHIHDGRYYTETEIASFFSGGTDITGYNNDNWDDAYSGEITGLSYSNGTITLARDSGNEADLTASISGSLDFGSGSVITADRFALKSDLDGTAEIPSWSLVEYDNQISAQEYTGTQTNRYPLIHTSNIVAKATAADFEKIFYLASTETNSDQTVGSIIIQED